jgi:gamma-glutamyltranspeptidase/glutathione hydrolase
MFLRTFALALVFAGAAQAQALPQKHMIASPHPLATEAGATMLKRGGSAVDAAIAAQLVMSLVEPQSSGIGGGAFLLHWDAKAQKVESFDGRETAPKAAGPDLFLGADGKPMGFVEAVAGGKSVGVPGVMLMLEMAHREHGNLPWSALFAPAIALAENGFPVSRRLAEAIARDPILARMPDTSAYFYPGGQALREGQMVKNPAYAASLVLLRDQGAKAMHQGPLAEAIVAAVRGAPTTQGAMTLDDLADFRPTKRDPVCGAYRGHTICSMGPPSSGAVTMLQTLAILERFNLKAMDPAGLQATHLYAEASRLAFADRDQYLADPAWMTVRVSDMLAPAYLSARARGIDAAQASTAVQPGVFARHEPQRRAQTLDYSRPSTAHVSIVDADGDAAALTTTVEGGFGSHLMAGGFILNNQLTDFVFNPVRDGAPAANAPGPGKRPLSSMAPAFVFGPDGRLKAVAGSPGGWRIIAYVTRTMMALIDWEMSATEAVSLIHVTARGQTIDLERDRITPGLEAGMSARGHKVRLSDLNSGLNIIRITPQGFDGAADPRREGTVWGE